MADNNKISIDIEIGASGQQQINQYKAAFDSLRTSITSLSNPITKLDNDISKLTTTINQLSSQNNSVGDSAIKIKENFQPLTWIIENARKAMTLLSAGTITLEAALTGD